MSNCPYCEDEGFRHVCLPPLPPVLDVLPQPEFNCPRCRQKREVRLMGFKQQGGEAPGAGKTCGAEFSVAYHEYADEYDEELGWVGDDDLS